MNDHGGHGALARPKYRADIDGLRAFAVSTVVVYHAYPSILPGGFIGVDVFFVISGFLISTIIFSSLERDTFSVLEFYNRRIRRIFPALLLVLLAILAVGWFVLLSDEYRTLGWHVAGGAGFVSNLVLWAESGYFDDAAYAKPLLHLWSLGIEEQFYLFWPLLLIFVSRQRSNFLKITILIAAISFALNVYLVQRSPVASFYSPLTRFWELMVGGGLAYIAIHRPELKSRFQNTQSAVGFILLGLSLIFINDNSLFPGWWASLPTLGAFFILSAGSNATLNRLLLTNKVAVWIGLISYPLYLWHWPLLSFARIIEFPAADRITRLVACLLAVGLASITYVFVETPIRTSRRGRLTAVGLLLAMVLVGSAGYFAYASNGFQNRPIAILTSGFVDDEQGQVYSSPEFNGQEIDLSSTSFGGTRQQSVLFIGDSLMGHYFPRVTKIFSDTGQLPDLSAVFAARNGCRPVPFGGDINSRGFRCNEYYEALMTEARQPKYSRLVIAANWNLMLSEPTYSKNIEHLQADLLALRDSGKQLFFLSMAPHSTYLDPLALTQPFRLGMYFGEQPPSDIWIDRTALEIPDQATLGKLKDLATAVNAEVINPFDFLCRANKCPAMVDGRPLYDDGYHFKAATARHYAVFIDRFLEDMEFPIN